MTAAGASQHSPQKMIEDRISCISTSGIVSAHKSRTCTVTVCSCTVHRQPRCVRIRHAANTSVRRGQFSRTVSPSQSSVPARMGRALFLPHEEKFLPPAVCRPQSPVLQTASPLFIFSVCSFDRIGEMCRQAVSRGLIWILLSDTAGRPRSRCGRPCLQFPATSPCAPFPSGVPDRHRAVPLLQ